jgi:hypothetical protein
VAFVSSAVPNGVVGSAYTTTIGVTGGEPPYAFSLAWGALPAGLQLDASGRLQGTPAQSGYTTFALTVTDAAKATASEAVTLWIDTPPPPPAASLQITPSSLPPGTLGVPYSAALASPGATAPAAFQISGGYLPLGLTLASDGTISGTPTSFGASSFTVALIDATGRKASATLSIDVTLPGLSLTAPPLPNGRVGLFYTIQLPAPGNTPEYCWSVSAGSLPPGIGLDPRGTLYGTPTVYGTSTFSLTVSDGASLTGSEALSFSIDPAPS